MISIDKVVQLVESSDQIQFLEADEQHDSVLNLHLAKPLSDELYQWLTALKRDELFELVRSINIRAGYYNYKVTKFDITQTRMVEFDCDDNVTVDGEMYVTFHLLPKGTKQMTKEDIAVQEKLEAEQPSEPKEPEEPAASESAEPTYDGPSVLDQVAVAGTTETPPEEPEPEEPAPQPEPESAPEPEEKPEPVPTAPEPSNPNEVVANEGKEGGALTRTSVYGHKDVTWDKVTPDKEVCAVVSLELAYNLDKQVAEAAHNESVSMGIVPQENSEEAEDTSDWFLLGLRTAYKSKEGAIKWNAKEAPILVPKRYIIDDDKKRVFGLVKINSASGTTKPVDLYLTQTIIDDLCLSFSLNQD